MNNKMEEFFRENRQAFDLEELGENPQINCKA
jgi:hypothetical protein